MKRMRRGGCYLLLGLLVLQMAGCGSSGKEGRDTEQNTKSSQSETDEISKKHFEYNRSTAIVLHTELDFEAMKIAYFDDVVELYQDKECKHKIYCQYEWDKERKNLSLQPPQYPVLNVSTVFASKSLLHEFEHSDYSLFEKGVNKDWGNLGRMYLVKWLDFDNGEWLDKPEIIEITIKGELDTPEDFQFAISEYGNGILFWKPVEGAERYLIVSATYLTQDAEISGFYEACDIIAETSETSWQSETEDDRMNAEFQTEYDTEEDREYYYGVIAVGKEGTSMVSNLIPKKEMAMRLPFCKEENGVDGESASARFAKSTDVLSRYQWIRLCDGTMSQRLIRYNVDRAEPVHITDWEEKPREMLMVPYIIEETDFEGTFYVEKFDRNTYKEKLQELQERQDILKSKMKGMLKNIEITVKPEMEERDTKGGKSEGVEEAADDPNGTTELSRYLAKALLQGKEDISVEGVQQGLDKETLTDAFYEAYYQNPLIPAVKKITVLESGEQVTVFYEDAIDERKRKQKELVEKVDFLAGELEGEGMSDVDKVLAINSCLCDDVEYDVKAAKQSEEGIFTDSMTPYGVLIDHKGVCLGYAGAFQLLAEAMGLDSIVVTGTLNGNQKHAWNKVKIDGKWCVVDVTSNDNDEIGNVLLNVSDEVADYLLKEDAHYICDESIGDFAADTEEFEYYRLAGKYYDKAEIAQAFIRELSLGQKAVFRTDVTLTNEEFQSIAGEVMEELQQEQLQGYYRLGVIYLSRR